MHPTYKVTVWIKFPRWYGNCFAIIMSRPMHCSHKHVSVPYVYLLVYYVRSLIHMLVLYLSFSAVLSRIYLCIVVVYIYMRARFLNGYLFLRPMYIPISKIFAEKKRTKYYTVFSTTPTLTQLKNKKKITDRETELSFFSKK